MAWCAGPVRATVPGEMPPGTFYPVPLATRGATSRQICRGVLRGQGQELQGRGQGQDGQCAGLDLEVCVGCDVVRRGVAWRGVAWRGVVWCGVIRVYFSGSSFLLSPHD